jgi:hypothetical protein
MALRAMTDRAIASDESWHEIEPLASKLITSAAEICERFGYSGPEFLRAAADYLEEYVDEQAIH